jgi:hypothetical protein
MERFNSLSGWSGQNNMPGQVKQKLNAGKLPAEYDISFKNMMEEVFGWSGSLMNVAEESSPGTDDSEWQNNEDPEAAEHSEESTGTGTTHGDTSIDNDLATEERLGGNEAAGAGAAGGTGGGGTSGGGIGGTTTSSNTGVAGIPG